MREEYSAVFNHFIRIFNIYGGVKSITTSPFFHVSVIVSFAIQELHDNQWKWYDVSISCLPSIIGMSLTGYALILTFGSDQFRDAIRGKESNGHDSEKGSDKASPYISASSSFAYVLFFQVISLIFSVLLKSINIHGMVPDFIGTWLLIYSLTLVIAVTLNTFFLSYMYDKMPK